MELEQSTQSVAIADMSSELLQARADTLGVRIDQAREERQYIQRVLHNRRMAEQRAVIIKDAHNKLVALDGTARVDGEAPGALIEVQASSS